MHMYTDWAKNLGKIWKLKFAKLIFQLMKETYLVFLSRRGFQVFAPACFLRFDWNILCQRSYNKASQFFELSTLDANFFCQRLHFCTQNHKAAQTINRRGNKRAEMTRARYFKGWSARRFHLFFWKKTSSRGSDCHGEQTTVNTSAASSCEWVLLLYILTF